MVMIKYFRNISNIIPRRKKKIFRRNYESIAWVLLCYDLLKKYINTIIIKKTIQQLRLTKQKYTEIIIVIKPTYLIQCIRILKNSTNFRFDTLLDLWIEDKIGQEYRYEITYLLASTLFNARIHLKILVKEREYIDTLSETFKAASWLEREAWEFFGINFLHHKDKRRLLTDYGFEWFPMKKDFPLSGIVEVKYDEISKRVVWKKLKTTQKYRTFKKFSWH